MNHELISNLFDEKFDKRISQIYPFPQKFFRERIDGSMEVVRVLENNVKVILWREKLNHKRFISLITKYGVDFFVSLTDIKTEKPYMVDIVNGMKRDEETLIDLSIDEVEYFIKKFIQGVLQDEEKKSV